jgi:pimeloyl-ACP methyl ester carboxylesterase
MLIQPESFESSLLNVRQRWTAHEEELQRFGLRFSGLHESRTFSYVQKPRFQRGVSARLRKPYPVPVAYSDWGPVDAPVVICMGGVVNTAVRFSFLAEVLCRRFRVICVDWLGRGRSGWLADDSEYGMPVYVEQLRQLLRHLRSPHHPVPIRAGPVTLLGSSMGGLVAMEFAARFPSSVQRLILNDIGPGMPKARRMRRAATVARFFVFRTPEELFRRVGASQKNDGPISEEVRRFIAYHQTRWSDEHGGRIYSHDVRALIAYRREAVHDVDHWHEWAQVRAPVLLLHGMESDALDVRTIRRMHPGHDMVVAHVPRTGHTPALIDASQTRTIFDWLMGALALPAGTEFSLPHSARTAELPVPRIGVVDVAQHGANFALNAPSESAGVIWPHKLPDGLRPDSASPN